MGLKAAVCRWLTLPGDTPGEVQKKWTWLVLMLSGFLPNLSFLLLMLFIGAEAFRMIYGLCSVGAFMFCIAHLLVGRRLSMSFYIIVTVVALMSIAVYDVVAMVTATRGWGYFVLVVDALLVGDGPDAVRVAAVAFILFWIAFSGSEVAFRWGMLDSPEMIPYEDRFETCEKPPCALGATSLVGEVFPATVIFYFDYVATAGFKRAVREEQRKINAAVATCRTVARSLADFDLQGAERCLTQGDDVDNLPEELATSFRRLVMNLRVYRPYLPDSLLRTDDALGDSFRSLSTASTSNNGLTRHDVARTHTDDDSLHSGPNSSAGSGSPAAHPLPALPRRQTVTRYTRKSQVTLIGVRLPALADADDQYVPQHSNYLTVVVQHVKINKGQVSSFVGDLVQASFNAFRKTQMHASLAANAARLIVGTQFMVGDGHPQANARCAVVTGMATVGNLGCSTVQSPNVFGVVVDVLEEVLEVGRLLGHKMLCTHATWMDAGAVHPLRVLLCEMQSGREGRGMVDRVLYTLDEEKGPTENPDVSGEWMYALEREPGTQWATYNDAGWLYHTDGAGPAAAYITRHPTPPALRQLFYEELQRAQVVSLVPQVTLVTPHAVEAVAISEALPRLMSPIV